MDREYKRSEIINLIKDNEKSIEGILDKKLELIVVGGFAFTAHIKSRLTHDIDFVNQLNEMEESALNALIESTGLSINNRSARKRSYGPVYAYSEQYLDNKQTLIFDNVILKFPRLEYLIASKFFDNRTLNNDATNVSYTNAYIDKEILEEIVSKIYDQNNPIINGYYRENALKIREFYRSRE